jgi:hypothetical protein
VIAHLGGVPLEETLAGFAPAVGVAAVAVGLLLEGARAWGRRLDPRIRSGMPSASDTDGSRTSPTSAAPLASAMSDAPRGADCDTRTTPPIIDPNGE